VTLRAHSAELADGAGGANGIPALQDPSGSLATPVATLFLEQLEVCLLIVRRSVAQCLSVVTIWSLNDVLCSSQYTGSEPGVSCTQSFCWHTPCNFTLSAQRTASRCAGVRLSDGSVLAADLVVDCSGRGSSLPAWLAAAGCPRPRTTRATVDAGYAAWWVCYVYAVRLWLCLKVTPSMIHMCKSTLACELRVPPCDECINL
jgi:hypothetical protein